MKILNWEGLSKSEKNDALRRPDTDTCAVQNDVRDIINTVKTEGDKAVLSYTSRFDGVLPVSLRIDAQDIEPAWQGLDEGTRRAMRRAHDNIQCFHQAQMPKAIKIEVEPGLICERQPRPIDCAGIYVPGGSAPLFSSLLMAAIPAKIAGVRRIIVASPPDKSGTIAPIILAAARLCGIDEIFCMGGAQAIAAMAFGTQSVPQADKLFGPGNQWVSEAKTQVAQISGGPAIDLPAGPSEVMVLADKDANPKWVAADLLSQAEHDPLAHIVLLILSNTIAHAVQGEVLTQIKTLPRAKIARAALQNAKIIKLKSRTQMLDIANTYAPEHLIIQCAAPETLIGGIRNAGSIFVGAYTPEALGDYASGTNHVLPTNGGARAYSGLGVESFTKYITVQRATKKALESLGPIVQNMARMEGLEAHARAISLRLGDA